MSAQSSDIRLPHAEEVNKQEVPINESENHAGLHRMQAPQLCDQEEQAEQSRTD